MGDIIKFKVNKVIKLSADWCAPCKQYAPVFDSVAQDYSEDWKIIIMDIDDVEGGDLAAGLGIRGVPATVFLVPGEDPQIIMGVQTDKFLRETFEGYNND